jgi:hypothetical protein
MLAMPRILPENHPIPQLDFLLRMRSTSTGSWHVSRRRGELSKIAEEILVAIEETAVRL